MCVLQSSALNDVVSSEDGDYSRYCYAEGRALRYCTHWITSNYGVSSLFDTAFTCRSYDGYVYVFVLLCVQCVLSAFHTDRCRL